MVASIPTVQDICSICLENIKEPYQLNCKHFFCSSCIIDYKNAIHVEKNIDPCIYGAPRCPYNNNSSCINRPCCRLDFEIMKRWEMEYPLEYRDWNIDESTKTKPIQKLSCPLCRKEI